MQNSIKLKKKKLNSNYNNGISNINSSNIKTNIIDENKNSLNYKNNNEQEKNIVSEKNVIIKDNKEKLNKLHNLKYIFPFFNEGQKEEENKIKNYSISEYNKIVNSINNNFNSKEINKKNKHDEEILEGNINIIDKIIQKYIPVSNDNKIIKIHPGLTHLSLKIDKNFNMLNDIGYRLPNLLELNLSNSDLESIMDIGTTFKKLEKLNVSNCGLSDLNGIICFQNLKELIASKNKINDLIYIEMCEEIKIIDLSYNLIEDENNLLFLNSCPKLQKVILTGNKIKFRGKNLLDKNIQLVI
jgi:hypothetical protein